MDIEQFENRKRNHIQHALDPIHQAMGLSGLDQLHLIHEALPDLDFHEIQLDSVCLKAPARTPFYVAGMTAGHPDAYSLNLMIALACQERGWAMGVGSQRRDLEASSTDSLASLDRWREFRKRVPRLSLFANLGIAQIIQAPLSGVQKVVEALEAQALVIHLNALQEVIQPEGTPSFKGAWSSLEKLCHAFRSLSVPIVLKETGCGFSRQTLQRLADLNLAAIDTSGLGGTHWGRIEGARSEEKSLYHQVSEIFANWGESTVDTVRHAVETLPDREIWASGGVRSGLDAAKLIALGAHRVGYAQPVLQAAMKGPEDLMKWMNVQEYALKVALFCTGSLTPMDLRLKQGVIRWNQKGI